VHSHDDWLEDLDAYVRFCADRAGSDAEVSQILTDLLVHVPNHVAAASKLYTGVPVSDVFGVGATRRWLTLAGANSHALQLQLSLGFMAQWLSFSLHDQAARAF